MAIKSILVHLDIDSPVEPLLGLAVEFAGRCGARLIGHSAADIVIPMAGPDGMVDGQFLQQQHDDIENSLNDLRGKFEAGAAGVADRQWRGGVGNPTRLLVDAARTADIILTAAKGPSGDSVQRSVDPGTLLLDAGRPVLIVADGAARLDLDRALIGWKDTREARRAIIDALPLLALAKEVVVATMASEDDSFAPQGLADVASYLGAHGIKAVTKVLPESDDADSLLDFATSMKASLIVLGAYGHSRLREWVFGGVTRSLLEESSLNRFMAN